jgi:Mg-chelatase subunit ChlI
MVDLVTPLVAGAGGALAGAVVAYVVFFRRPTSGRAEVLVREPEGALRSSSVTQAQLERSRREMRTMMVERDLLSSALMKVYEAETEGRITKEEREMIAKRYSDQLKEIQGKLKDVELVVEVGELEKLREELVDLFQDPEHRGEARPGQGQARRRRPAGRQEGGDSSGRAQDGTREGRGEEGQA